MNKVGKEKRSLSALRLLSCITKFTFANSALILPSGGKCRHSSVNRYVTASNS